MTKSASILLAAALASQNTADAKTATATFAADTHDGVSGTITFTQEDTAHDEATSIDLDLTLADGTDFGADGLKWHVHKFPGTGTDCGLATTGGHLNPTDAALCTSNNANCELGDLSGKHGKITESPMEINVNEDDNCPLYGENSIVGRSIVIHEASGDRWVCAVVEDEDANDAVVLTATFTDGGDTGDLTGAITFTQPPGDEAYYLVDLDGVTSNDNTYHVHESAISNGCGADSTGGHWDPDGVKAAATADGGTYNCTSAEEADWAVECEMGDLSGKSGALIFPATDDSKVFITDSYLDLSGDDGIDGLSIVVHNSDGDRIACADLVNADGDGVDSGDGSKDGGGKKDVIIGVCAGVGGAVAVAATAYTLKKRGGGGGAYGMDDPGAARPQTRPSLQMT